MSAIRLARGFTGRSTVVKFAGCYHGHVDSLLAAAGLGPGDLRPARLPGGHRRPGRRDDRAALQRPRAAVEALFAQHGDEHRGGHHRGRRGQHGRRAAAARASTPGSPELCRAHGALLVIDEVMTGFRVVAAAGSGSTGARGRGRPTCSPSARSWAAGCPPRPSAAAPTSWRTSPRPARSTRRARWPGTRSPPPAGWPRCGTCDDRRLRPPRRRGRAGRPTWLARRWPPPGSPTACSAAGNLFSVFFTDAAGAATTTTPRPRSPGGTRAFFHAMLDAGRLPAAVGVRGVVRLGRPRRAALDQVAAALPGAARAAARSTP